MIFALFGIYFGFSNLREVKITNSPPVEPINKINTEQIKIDP